MGLDASTYSLRTLRSAAQTSARATPGAPRILGSEREDEDGARLDGEIDGVDDLDGATSARAATDATDCPDGNCALPPSLDGKGTRINTFA